MRARSTWGSIDGVLEATERIGLVRSGAAITATLNAPQIGVVSPDDPRLAMQGR
jgi:hypothetical protein